MKIGIIGTRGIPNHYGGFEQTAQYLSAGLVKKGHDVFVYSPHDHPYPHNKWNGVNIVHCYDPENKIGTIGQFIYDFNCINDARKRNFDILLHLGYSSDSIWYWRWPKNAINVMNMDGLEWKRSKYGKLTKKFLKKAEWLAAKKSDLLIADSTRIQRHIMSRYGKHSAFIPYGADLFKHHNASVLNDFGLSPHQYYILVARMEPENNIEMVIKGYLASKKQEPLVVVGSVSNKYGHYLLKHFTHPNIIFTGPVYESRLINNLRYYSLYYFHGHSVGGTNPSLLEGMACGCNIAAHRNVFNKAVLQKGGDYFSSEFEITDLINFPVDSELAEVRKQFNFQKIQSVYNWESIIDKYEMLMLEAIYPKEKTILDVSLTASKTATG